MTRHFKYTKSDTFKTTAFLWMFIHVFGSFAQISTDLNLHIKTDDPTQKIVYTALKKGFISLKAEVQLVDGELKVLNDQRFEDVYLKPLLDRYQEHNGRIYQEYLELFYLFVQINGDENETMKVLDKTLATYEQMIAGFERSEQQNPLKVVLISASPKLAQGIMNRESSLISLEGDYSHLDQRIHFRKMPVIGLNFDNLDLEKLSGKAKSVHRKGKKLRLYNVPRDQALWESLIQSGVDFINCNETHPLLSKSH